MVLDAFTALSLASSIVQFVDFGTRLVSETKEFYLSASGVKGKYPDLKAIAESIKRLNSQIPTSIIPTPTSPEEENIVQIALACNGAADELLALIQRMDTRAVSGKLLSSFRQACIVLGNKKKLEELAAKMFQLRDQVMFCLQIIFNRSTLTKEHFSKYLMQIHALFDDIKERDATIMAMFSKMESGITEVVAALSQHFHSQVQKATITKEQLVEVQEEVDAKKRRVQTKEEIDENEQRIQALQERLTTYERRVDSITDELLPTLGPSLSSWIQEGHRVMKIQKILLSLYFPFREVRHEQIPMAHKSTFQWMFVSQTESNDKRAQLGFIEWLRSGDSIFWISGKAGAGKSTLMKFLSDDPRTREALDHWGKLANSEVVLASFFFWNPGTDMQKSIKGLLQSILYEILRKCPSLIPIIASNRWSDSEPQYDRPNADRAWTQKELNEAFGKLRSQHCQAHRFCFFIDGLDEFEGEHHDVVNLLQTLAENPKIKICVSSRPWNIFQSSFGGRTKTSAKRSMLLEELTREDIELYVRDAFENHAVNGMLMESTGYYEELVHDITQRAQGVFFWVFLVMRSLLMGVTNADRISELRRRLDEIPTDLEALFKKLMDQTEGFYHEQAAMLFQLALEATEPVSLLTLSFADEENPEYALDCEMKSMPADEIWQRLRLMKRRINARCNGLLEVAVMGSPSPQLRYELLQLCNAFETQAEQLDYQVSEFHHLYKVVFLHRTVRDFLLSKDVQSLFRSWISTPYVPRPVLCRAYLGEIKQIAYESKKPQRNAIYLSGIVEQMLEYAFASEHQDGQPQVRALEELVRFSQYFFQTKDPLGTAGKTRLKPAEYAKVTDTLRILRGLNDHPLRILAQRGYQAYVLKNFETQFARTELTAIDWILRPSGLRRDEIRFATQTLSMLLDRISSQEGRTPEQMAKIWDLVGDTIFQNWTMCSEQERRSKLDLVKLFLKNGANPNQQVRGFPVWAKRLHTLFSATDVSDLDRLELIDQLVDVFLSEGANPNQKTVIELEDHVIKHTTVWGMVLYELLKCERRLNIPSPCSSLPRIGSMPRDGDDCVTSQHAIVPSIRLRSVKPSRFHLLCLQLIERFLCFGADTSLRLPIDVGLWDLVEPTAFEVAKICTAQAEGIDVLFHPRFASPQVENSVKGGFISTVLRYISFRF